MAPRHVLLVGLVLALQTMQMVTGGWCRARGGCSPSPANAARRLPPVRWYPFPCSHSGARPPPLPIPHKTGSCTLPRLAGRRLLGDAPPAAPANAATTLPDSALPDSLPYNEGGEAVELKIINGDNVTSSEFDFMVALFQQVPGRQPRFFCGGVLLDNTTVLTGAPAPPSA